MCVGTAVAVADYRRDSLAEIKQLLNDKAPDLREVLKSTKSLRHSYPSVNVAESIYNEADRMSIYSESDPIVASSQLEFDFDDVVVDSAVYRRVMAAAKNHTPHLRQKYAPEAPVANEENATISIHRRLTSKDKEQNLSHGRQNSQTKRYPPHSRQDDAHEATSKGKEITTISTRREFGSDKHGRNHERQHNQTKADAHPLRQDNAHVALILGKENITVNTHRSCTNKNCHCFHRQDLLVEHFEAGESHRVQIRVTPKRSRRPSREEQEDQIHGDLIEFSDDDTKCQAVKDDLPQQVPRLFEDLIGLQFPVTVCLS